MNSKNVSSISTISVATLAVAALCSNAAASGFGLYEASSKTYALGGTVVGKAVDASANFHNPATLTDLTNITITAGVMTESPWARIRTDNGSSTSMHPGTFVLPSFHLAVPFAEDFAFGLGVMPEYGLGSKYGDNWALNYNSTETTIAAFTVNPNLAWKKDRFSIAAGLRFIYFDFDQHIRPWAGKDGQYYGRLTNQLKGDNDMEDFGYQVGVKYDASDDFSVGLVYKSRTKTHVRGENIVSPRDVNLGTMAFTKLLDGPAAADLTLPDSISGGFNWDISDTWHLGGIVTWTQWSTLETLDFNLNGFHKPVKLNWEDTWRIGISPSWDFADGWTAIMSYVYENDCCGDQESTMLPASDRHMLSWGLCWDATDALEVALTYGMIIMDGKETQARDSVTGELHHYTAHCGISHATGITLTYNF